MIWKFVELKIISRFYNSICIAIIALLLQSCSVSKQISKQAQAILINDTVISTGHIGISIYEPSSQTYWYNYNADKYFVPASNTKLFTLYAGMKYLGDSLVGLRYQNFSDTSVTIMPAGDPTLLHPDFSYQPVIKFLTALNKNIYIANNFRDSALGYGWAWDDYNEGFMRERNAMPVYGNAVKLTLRGIDRASSQSGNLNWNIIPSYFAKSISNFRVLSYDILARRDMQDSTARKKKVDEFKIVRDWRTNDFYLIESGSKFTESEIPFRTYGINTAKQILREDFHLNIKEGWQADNSLYGLIPPHLQWHSINSQPTDSLLALMMHNSDNFFAEQTLLMASNEHLGYMNDEAIIDTLLKTDLKDVLQKPNWVDGSGLSRYNQFTPQSFIYILNKLRDEFGMERLKTILPTGGEGTLKNYYQSDSGFIYAKTGSLSGQTALSGFLITKQNKLLVFSILANNVQGSGSAVRRAFEHFLENIRSKY